MKYKLYASVFVVILSHGLVAMTDENLKEPSKFEILAKAIKDHDLAAVRASLLVQPLTNQQVKMLIEQACHAQATAAEQLKPAYNQAKVNSLVLGGLCGAFACSFAYELVKGFNPFLKYYAGKILEKKIVLNDKKRYIVEALLRAALLGATGALAAYFFQEGLTRDAEHTNLSKAGKIITLLQMRSLCSTQDLATQEQAPALIS